jgi:hypothetical protein
MQQLLDKWERLRRSEYLRPDEKLMLNHCISDLKYAIEREELKNLIFQIVEATLNQKQIYRLYLNQKLHSEHDTRESALHTQIEIKNTILKSREQKAESGDNWTASEPEPSSGRGD